MSSCFPIAAALVLAALPLFAVADNETVKSFAAETRYLSGGVVKVDVPVAGDLYAFGGQVNVAQSVSGLATLAAGDVRAAGDMGGDLRAAGGRVNIDARVGKDLSAAGGEVHLGPAAQVLGNASIAGGEVAINGSIDGNAKVYAGKITLAGRVGGDARLVGDELQLLPGAVIVGNLHYASRNPLSDEQRNLVKGQVIREDGERPAAAQVKSGFWFHPMFGLSMLACGSLLFLLFPNAIGGVQQSIGQAPLRSALLGLATLVALPLLALFFVLTIIGIPIGFTLMLMYPLVLMLGYVSAAFVIGRKACETLHQHDGTTTPARQILFFALALVLLGIVAGIPFLGRILVFFALITGIGGWAGWAYRRLRQQRAVPGSEVAV